MSSGSQPAQDVTGRPPGDEPSGDVPRRVALLRADAALAEALPPDQRAFAERTTLVPVLSLPEGTWEPPSRERVGRNPYALMLLDGVVTSEILLAGRPAAQLLGPGDVLEPWSASDALMPVAVRWTVNAAGTAAVLDERFLAAARHSPALISAVHQRLAAQCERMSLHAAINSLGRIELRVLALFWHLAERWGRVGPDGVIVPMRLTHEAIGRLVGARRPTVTLAIGELTEGGLMSRHPDGGGWVLARGSQEALVSSDGLAA